MNNFPQRNAAPLSYSQQRLWFLDQWEPMSPLYTMFRVVRMTGSLNIESLHKSLDVIVARHEVLRTTFAAVDGNPMQQTREDVAVPLPLIDLAAKPESERQAEMQRCIDEEAERPFDLASDLMLRVSLLRLREDEHVLLLTMHHIASDGWSMGIFFRELSLLYEAFCAGKPSPLPELPIQYADFALWQKNWLQGDVLKSQLGYWKKQLASAPARLELSAGRRRPAVQTFRGASYSFTLPSTLTQGIQSLSRGERGTLFITLLAAFATLLHRHMGGHDIVVGSPIAGRNRYEIEELIGFFVNTLVLRTDLSGNPTFRELLGRVRDVALDAYAHQDLPFEKLVEELQPERNLSHHPLFQVMFVLQNTRTPFLSLRGLTVSELKVERGTAKFDLSLSMVEKAGELTGAFEYNTDLFDEATIARMLGHFRTLLEGIVTDPDQRLSDLSLLTEPERHKVLVEWNANEQNYPQFTCVHEVFESQAERTPEAVAVVSASHQLTYRELNQRANQLARYLVKLGVGPEVRVALCVERSMEAVIGILAILKAGGAYLPLDPEYPKKRLAFMLEDSGAQVLLTQSKLLSQPNMTDDRRPQTDDDARSFTPQRSSVIGFRSSVICLDKDWTAIGAENDTNIGRDVTSDNLAYVIYTSGSTGNPKGVLIDHRSIARHCHDARKEYALGPEDRVLQSSSLSFDVSLEQIFPILLVGGGLVLGKIGPWDPTDLQREIVDSELTVINVPAAFWGELARRWSRADLSASKQLRLIVVGGDLMPTKDLGIWQQSAMNSARLLNAYGPTEATITATTFEIHPHAYNVAPPERIPIGRPFGGRRIYLLDARMQPVPVGVPGEAHIGGAALARGYLNRPDLTAEKFIPNPFSTEPGARLYKTGDRARYLPDGNIEFLGRMDHQVKIRGFRIELGEIETALADHPGVRQSAAIVREDEPGNKRLVAYVVAKPEFALATTDLRGFLKDKLPEYMIPSAFVMLDALPLTPNGKVDRKVLPAPDQSRPEQENPFVPPSTVAEKTIAEIWAHVLKVDRVGIHDNFFESGGHSLLATQVMSRVCAAFQVELPLRSLFETPTVAGLAAQVAQTKAPPEETASVLAELESLSDEQAQLLLAQESP
jgi:amino acid adenylation domain-containing protein